MTISVVGVPHLSGPDGEDLTPRGHTLRALVAAIALSPRQVASRRWLEGLLWPEGTSSNASGSLRQALTMIRRSLGDHADILIANRLDVTLDPERTRVDLNHHPAEALAKLKAGREVLEGIDVRSETFEDWLRMERAAVAEMIDQAGPMPGAAGHSKDAPILFAEQIAQDSSLESFVADTISAQLSQTATAHSRMEVRTSGDQSTSIKGAGTRCNIRVKSYGKDLVAIVRLTEEPSGRVLWQRRAQFGADDPDSTFDIAAALALEATEAFVFANGKSTDAQRANALAASALELIFSFDPKLLKEADEKLTLASSMDAHAPRPALQALGRAFATLEDPQYDQDRLNADVEGLIGESLKLDGGNPMALAFIADVYDLVFDDSETAMSLLKRAIAMNPGIGFAYASLGALELRRGQVIDAHNAASRAQRQLANTSLEVFSLMRLCITSMYAGETDQAIRAAERAADLAPLSCPPLRHLYALRLSKGDLEGARDARRRLNRLEPGFSMLRIREDPYFPAPSIRGMGFHNLADVEI